jgi:hypothetical protein
MSQVRLTVWFALPEIVPPIQDLALGPYSSRGRRAVPSVRSSYADQSIDPDPSWREETSQSFEIRFDVVIRRRA